jgi:hypothetical protein
MKQPLADIPTSNSALSVADRFPLVDLMHQPFDLYNQFLANFFVDRFNPRPDPRIIYFIAIAC